MVVEMTESLLEKMKRNKHNSLNIGSKIKLVDSSILVNVKKEDHPEDQKKITDFFKGNVFVIR